MTVSSRQAIRSVSVVLLSLLMYGATPAREIESVTRKLMADLVAGKYEAATEEFHYAATMSEDARVEDRKLMVVLTRAFFANIDGLPSAERASDLDAADLTKGFLRVGLFAGNESDWRIESTRLPSTRVSYRVGAKGQVSLALSFGYVHPQDRWELLDILLLAPSHDAEACGEVADTAKRLAELIRKHARMHPGDST